jgi:cation diffusion facilitator family transporter
MVGQNNNKDLDHPRNALPEGRNDSSSATNVDNNSEHSTKDIKDKDKDKDKDKENREKLKVAIVSIVASLGLTIFKLVVAFFTNSLGILAEGLHSGLDVIAAMMTFYAIRMVIRPADIKYTFGYAKYESVSSLSEVILLLAVAGWIFYEGVERIFFKTIQPEITIFSFLVLFLSIAIDFARSRALYNTARKYGSQALEADALHFKTDMLSSSIVIVGLLLVFLTHIPYADAYAAIAVAGMIIYTSLGLGRRTLDVLLDKAPKGSYQRVVETISGLDGVNKAHDIRVRKMGSETLVDMHIEVPRTSTHEKAHNVATRVEEKVREAIPGSNVLVHVDAVKTETETILDSIRLIASETEGIKNVHSIYLSTSVSPSSSTKAAPDRISAGVSSSKYLGYSTPKDNEVNKRNDEKSTAPKLHLYLDVQMNEGLDLKSAHTITDSFESRIKSEIPHIHQITTHIETEINAPAIVGTERKVSPYEVEDIRTLVLSVDGVLGCKDIGMIDTNGQQHITLTIQVNSTPEKELTINDAHQLATHIQNLIINKTGASRVVVHTEPAST